MITIRFSGKIFVEAFDIRIFMSFVFMPKVNDKRKNKIKGFFDILISF